jgi:hypothetical protein
MDAEKVDYTVFKAALSVLATALTGKGDVLADDTLTEWAARKVKVFVPFGKDYAVLEVKARHKVGLSEETLGYVAHLALSRVGRVAELVEGVTTRNGQVVSVKTVRGPPMAFARQARPERQRTARRRRSLKRCSAGPMTPCLRTIPRRQIGHWWQPVRHQRWNESGTFYPLTYPLTLAKQPETPRK